jgi:hypothetical protein
VSRPNAAFVGMGLSHPIRVVMNRGLHGNVAKLVTINEALELMTDLTAAIARAIEQEAARNTPNACPDASCPTRRTDIDDLPPTG